MCSSVSDCLDLFVRVFTTLKDWVVKVFDILLDILTYGFSIIKTIFFGLTSLLSEIADLLDDVFLEGDFFHNIGQTFSTLGDYIGFPGVVLLSTLLLITMLRILIAFVFKIFRLNIDYKMRETGWKKTHNREPTDYVEDETYPRLPS